MGKIILVLLIISITLIGCGGKEEASATSRGASVRGQTPNKRVRWARTTYETYDGPADVSTPVPVKEAVPPVPPATKSAAPKSAVPTPPTEKKEKKEIKKMAPSIIDLAPKTPSTVIVTNLRGVPAEISYCDLGGKWTTCFLEPGKQVVLEVLPRSTLTARWIGTLRVKEGAVYIGSIQDCRSFVPNDASSGPQNWVLRR